MFDFNYSCLKNMYPIVTISSISISFNKGAADMIGMPKSVGIGYDKKNHVLGITPSNYIEWEDDYPQYEFSSRMRQDWIRIGARDFIRYLSDLTGISFDPAVQFIPELDEYGKTLLVFVDSDHIRNRK